MQIRYYHFIGEQEKVEKNGAQCNYRPKELDHQPLRLPEGLKTPLRNRRRGSFTGLQAIWSP